MMKYANLLILGLIAVVAVAGLVNSFSPTGKAIQVVPAQISPDAPLRPLYTTVGGSMEQQQIFRSGYPQMIVVDENNLPQVQSPMPFDLRGKAIKSRPQQIVVVSQQ